MVMLPSRVKVYSGDCRKVMPRLVEGSVDAVVTDPPYELGFMGRRWDSTGVAFDSATWEAALRVLKPGGYLLAMGGTRTYHRLTCAVEDTGFEIRDCLMWLYGSGFPKGKGCLKPAYEPVVLARKPGKVLPLGVDECRVPTNGERLSGGDATSGPKGKAEGWDRPWMHNPEARAVHAAKTSKNVAKAEELGRWPANVVHDGSDEVLEAFAAFGKPGGGFGTENRADGTGIYGKFSGSTKGKVVGHGDTGTAARFFYTAKASKAERDGSTHPTIKPLALMRWLVKLVCPPSGMVLDPFLGSGSTAIACLQEGRRCVGIEQDLQHYFAAKERIARYER